MSIKFSMMIVLALVLLSACSQQPEATQTVAAPQGENAPQNTPASPNATAYPIGPASSLQEGYPIGGATATVYPPDMRAPDFSIDEPLNAGATVVTGTGPANVPIHLVNVSLVGELIATTTITPEGTFRFVFDKPLEAGITIGLQIGDLEGTGFEEGQFIYNETYFERPMVGILFDIVNIRAP